MEIPGVLCSIAPIMSSSSSGSTPPNPKSTKEDLHKELDKFIYDESLTDLHTHLMGMGSADFWVTKIMETYLPRRYGTDKEIYYPLSTLMEASGFKATEDSVDISLFEARFFEGFADQAYNLHEVLVPESFDVSPILRRISNTAIVEMLKLEYENGKHGQKSGPFRALVRNWFQFLSPSGNATEHADVLQTCKCLPLIKHTRFSLCYNT